MAEAKKRSDWERTSAILALTANCNRDPKKHPKAFDPEDFNPFAPPKPKELVELEKARAFEKIKSAFTGQVVLEKK